MHKNRIKVFVDGDNKYYLLRALKRALPGVVVKVGRCLIERESHLDDRSAGNTDRSKGYYQHPR